MNGNATIIGDSAMKTVHSLFCILALSLSLAATPAWSSEGHTNAPATSKDMAEYFEDVSKENGYKIFFVGRNTAGKPIKRKGGPNWLYMHGGGCANCHGDEGRGGIVPIMCSTVTPAITLKALMNPEHMHNDKEKEHTPYTIETIRRALEKSVNSDGKSLSPCMPKWFLSDNDFRDLLYQLKELDK